MRWPQSHSHTTRAPTIRAEVAHHIDDLDPEAWDSLALPDDLQASHRFVKVCQDAAVEDAEYRHVLVRIGGRPACIASLSAMDVRLELLSGTALRSFVERVRHIWPSFLKVRVLLGGLPVSFGQSCLRIAPWADRNSVLRVLADIIDDAARETQAGLIAVKELSPDEAARVEGLCDLGFIKLPSLPSCWMPIRWASFSDYVASMRAPYRRQLMASLRRSRRHGLEVRTVAQFGAHCDRIFGLYEAVMDRAEYQLERLNLAFFQRLNETFGEQSSAILAERGDDLLAVAIVLDGPTKSTFLIAGIDYEHHRQTSAYLNLVAEVVAHAIERGAHVLEMGQTSYYLKTRLGAQLEPRHIFMRHRSPLWHRCLRVGGASMFPERTFESHRIFRSP